MQIIWTKTIEWLTTNFDNPPPRALRWRKKYAASPQATQEPARVSLHPPPSSQPIQRTLHPARAALHYVRVDHRRAHIGMAQQLLHRANVIARFEQVRRK